MDLSLRLHGFLILGGLAGWACELPQPPAPREPAATATASALPLSGGAMGPAADATTEPQRSVSPTNAVERLIAHAQRINDVEILNRATRKRLAQLSPLQLARVSKSLERGTLRDTYALSTPPWPVILRFRFHEGPPLIAHLVSPNALRLPPHDSYSSSLTDAAGRPRPDVKEMAVGGELFDALVEILGPPDKEYQPATPINLDQLTAPIEPPAN